MYKKFYSKLIRKSTEMFVNNKTLQNIITE